MATDARTLEQTIRNRLGFEPGQEAYFNQHRRRYAETLSLLPDPAPDARLLDIGFLPGHLGTVAVARGYTVSGITNVALSDAMSKRVHDLGVDLHRADIETEPLPFEDDTFDTVLFCEVIEHLYRDPFHALAEIFRVLRPGGRLILTTPNLAAFEKLAALARGFSYRTPLTAPRQLTFPPRLSYTHFREYTDRELVYMLRWQDQQIYRFNVECFRFSRCWQPTTRDILRSWKQPVRFAGRVAVALMTRVLRRGASSIMIRALKPSPSAWIHPGERSNLSGFFDAETDRQPDDRTRDALPCPFRWTGAEASWRVPLPKPGPVAVLGARCGFAAPDEVPARRCHFTIDGKPVLERRFPPRREFVNVWLPVPVGFRDATHVDIGIRTEPWNPAEFGFPDSRRLGIMVADDRMLALGKAAAEASRLERRGCLPSQQS